MDYSIVLIHKIHRWSYRFCSYATGSFGYSPYVDKSGDKGLNFLIRMTFGLWMARKASLKLHLLVLASLWRQIAAIMDSICMHKRGIESKEYRSIVIEHGAL